MMDKVFLSILETFIIFGFGALAWRFKMIQAEEMGRLTRLTLDLFFPLLTFSTITRNFDPASLNELWIMPLLGVGIMLAGAGMGVFLKRLFPGRSPERLATIHHIAAINNYVFLPIIVLGNTFGERHIALLLVMNVGSTVGFWTVGIWTFTGVGSVMKVLKSIFSVNIAAVLAALLVCFLGIKLPESVAFSLKYLGDAAVPFMLVLIGAALVNCFKSIRRDWQDVVLISLLRLVVIPVVVLLLLKTLPLPREVFETAVVVALMPAASSSVLVARQYGGDQEFAGQVIVASTLFSLATIPLLMQLLI